MHHKSARLRMQDVRDVFRLIGECRDLGCDPRAWREQLLSGLCRIIGAQLGVGGLECWAGARDDVPQAPVAVGWPSQSSQRAFARFVAEVDYRTQDPLAAGFNRLRGSATQITKSREQLIDDSSWYRSHYFNEYRKPCEVDDCIDSVAELPGHLCDVISVQRVLNDRRFSARDLALLEEVHRELRPLLGTVLKLRGPSAHELSPRLRELLIRLLKGDSEKQAARAMSLAPSTTHQYVHQIYRHFAVASRGELMALFVRVPFPSDRGALQ